MIKNPPDEDELSRLLDSLQQTLVAQGLCVHCDHTFIFKGGHSHGVPARSAPRNETRSSVVATGPRPSSGYGPANDEVTQSMNLSVRETSKGISREESSNGPAHMEKVTEVEESSIFLESQTALEDPNWRCVILTSDTAHRILQAVALERDLDAQGA